MANALARMGSQLEDRFDGVMVAAARPEVTGAGNVLAIAEHVVHPAEGVACGDLARMLCHLLPRRKLDYGSNIASRVAASALLCEHRNCNRSQDKAKGS